MSVALYMDVHIPRPVTHGLRLRSVTVLRSQDDNTTRFSDVDLLDRATALGYVLVTQDEDFLVEAARRQTSGIPFAGVVFARQMGVTIGQCIDDLELLAKVYDPPEMANRLVYLPL